MGDGVVVGVGVESHTGGLADCDLDTFFAGEGVVGDPPGVVYRYSPSRAGKQGEKLLESNIAQNRIPPVRLTTRNALFAGHDEGAAAWGRIASLVETSKMNGVEPCSWLKITLEKIAAAHPQSRIHQMLPWAFDPAPN